MLKSPNLFFLEDKHHKNISSFLGLEDEDYRNVFFFYFNKKIIYSKKKWRFFIFYFVVKK